MSGLMTETRTNSKGQPGLVPAALFGLCPDCGAKTLYDGAAQFAERCDKCGLDYSAFNVGDGPAALLTMAIGAFIITAAIALDVAVRPPFWVHVVIWVPLTGLMVLACLRFTKGALLVAEHRNKAKEGQLADQDDTP
jgi:uncharacterized protein (DUF983 family)